MRVSIFILNVFIFISFNVFIFIFISQYLYLLVIFNESINIYYLIKSAKKEKFIFILNVAVAKVSCYLGIIEKRNHTDSCRCSG